MKAIGWDFATAVTAKEHGAANDSPTQKSFETSFGERWGLACVKFSLNEFFKFPCTETIGVSEAIDHFCF